MMDLAPACHPPADIEVHRPHSLAEMQRMLRETEPPHFFVAGGTDLLVMYRDGVLPPSAWIDITALDELRGIAVAEGCLRLGALACHEELARSPLVLRHAPTLGAACSLIGGPQVRWRGTLGGNLANASPAGDTIPALYVLGATVEILAADGQQREVPVAELFVGPRRSILADGDLVVAVRLPLRENLRGAYLRLGQRQSQAISKVSVAVAAVLDGLRFVHLSIACGAVAPTVVTVPLTEAVLREGGLTPPTIEKAAATIGSEIHPITDLRSTEEYRRAMAGVLLRRALGQVARLRPLSGGMTPH